MNRAQTWPLSITETDMLHTATCSRRPDQHRLLLLLQASSQRGPRGGSSFSCLVYSSSSTHNPLRAGGPSLAPLFPWVPPAAESRGREELLHSGPKSSHQMWKVRVTHTEFYVDSNEPTAFCPDFVVELCNTSQKQSIKKVKNVGYATLLHSCQPQSIHFCKSVWKRDGWSIIVG